MCLGRFWEGLGRFAAFAALLFCSVSRLARLLHRLLKVERCVHEQGMVLAMVHARLAFSWLYIPACAPDLLTCGSCVRARLCSMNIALCSSTDRARISHACLCSCICGSSARAWPSSLSIAIFSCRHLASHAAGTRDSRRQRRAL